MIRTKEEIMQSVNTLLGESSSDAGISVLEDLNDTLADYEERTKDSTDWKAKYENNDKEWREKYRNRFFSDTDEPEEPDPVEEPVSKKYSFDELFKEV